MSRPLQHIFQIQAKSDQQLIDDVRASLVRGWPVNGCHDGRYHHCETPLIGILYMQCGGRCTINAAVAVIDILFVAGCDSEELKPPFWSDRRTAFHMATSFCKSPVPILKCLLRNGAKIPDHRVVLDGAMIHQTPEVLHFLIDNGVRIFYDKGTFWGYYWHESDPIPKYEVLFRRGSPMPTIDQRIMTYSREGPKYHGQFSDSQPRRTRKLYTAIRAEHDAIGTAVDLVLPLELVRECQQFSICP